MNNKQAIQAVLSDGKEHKVQEITDNVILLTGKLASETGISAETRDLRKKPYFLPVRSRALVIDGRKSKTWVYWLEKQISALEAEKVLNA